MIEELGSYYIWAHDRYRKVMSDLSDEEFERVDQKVGKSVRQLVTHMILITAYSYMDEDSVVELSERVAGSDKDSLLLLWKEVDLQMADTLKSVSTERTRVIQTPTGDKQAEVPEDLYFLSFTDHNTFHRGQLLSMLKSLGRPGVSSDLFYYCFERGGWQDTPSEGNS